MNDTQLVSVRKKSGIERAAKQFSTTLISLVYLSGLLSPAIVFAQDANLLQPQHQFEIAKASGDFAAAVKYGRQVLELAERQYGSNSLDIIGPLKMLGEVLVRLENYAEAERYYGRALDIEQREFGNDHPELVSTLEALVNTSWQQEHFPEAESLLTRILKIEQSVYGEKHENVVITWNRLRDLYSDMGKSDDVARVDATIESLSVRTRDFELDEPGDTRRRNAADGFATVRVFYGTNRARSGKSKAPQFYGTERGDLELGYLDVSIPKNHKYGELETKPLWSIFSYKLGEDVLKKKYVLLLSVKPLGEQSFYTQLGEHVQDSPTNDIFLFVHGYNSSFSDAARRTAQLAYDLDFDGTPMMFSWPSQESAASYTIDEAVVRVSGRKMARLLTGIVEQAGADRIHVIAHSMGNRALIEALATFVAGRDPAQPARVFDQVVFTAPDVDRDYFIDVVEDIKQVASRVTLYASENDLALQTSAALHGAPRAGLAGDSIVTVAGLDTIDMSAVEADILGHSYFAASDGPIYDLFRLLWKGDPPEQRCGMNLEAQDIKGFWLFDVDTCRGSDVLEAGLLIKRFGRRAREEVQRHLGALKDDADVAAREEWSRILDRIDNLLNSDDD